MEEMKAIYVDKEDHRKLKMLSGRDGRSLRSLVHQAVSMLVAKLWNAKTKRRKP